MFTDNYMGGPSPTGELRRWGALDLENPPACSPLASLTRGGKLIDPEQL